MKFSLGERVLVLADKFDGLILNSIKVCDPNRDEATCGFNVLIAKKEIRTIETRIVAHMENCTDTFLVEILPEHHLYSWNFLKDNEPEYICLEPDMIGKKVWCASDFDMGKIDSSPFTLKSIPSAGQTCIGCREFQIYAEPNLKSGGFACWSCRNDPRNQHLELV